MQAKFHSQLKFYIDKTEASNSDKDIKKKAFPKPTFSMSPFGTPNHSPHCQFCQKALNPATRT